MPEAAARFRRRMKLLIPVMSALLIASFALASWSFSQAHSASCERANATLNVLRDLIVIAQAQTDSDPTVPQAKKDVSDAFVARAKARIDQARC